MLLYLMHSALDEQIAVKRYKLTSAIQTPGSGKGNPKKTPEAAVIAVKSVLETVLSCLDESKAEEIVTIDIQDKSALCDYMVIASGRSQRHVGAVADQLIRSLKKLGNGAPKVEGLEGADWVLIDAGDIVVHLFRPEVREFYALEKMWQMPASEDLN